MNLFNVEWDKLNVLLLPTFMRKMRLFAFVKAATKPLWTIYRRFADNRAETLFILQFDTSKGNVERVLNKRFETDGIYITNNATVDDDTVYLSNDDIAHLPVYLGSLVSLTPVEHTYFDDTLYLDFYIDPKAVFADFTIMVPVAVDAVWHDEIIRFAALFILPGFRFSIVTY
jgi:hypothetical protein